MGKRKAIAMDVQIPVRRSSRGAAAQQAASVASTIGPTQKVQKQKTPRRSQMPPSVAETAAATGASMAVLMTSEAIAEMPRKRRTAPGSAAKRAAATAAAAAAAKALDTGKAAADSGQASVQRLEPADAEAVQGKPDAGMETSKPKKARKSSKKALSDALVGPFELYRDRVRPRKLVSPSRCCTKSIPYKAVCSAHAVRMSSALPAAWPLDAKQLLPPHRHTMLLQVGCHVSMGGGIERAVVNAAAVGEFPACQHCLAPASLGCCCS